MEHFEKIANDIFKQYGVDFTSARRAVEWTNATCIAGGLALRISKTLGNDKIRREVLLASLLPKYVGYPINIATGVTDGYEWSLSNEIAGVNLSDIWETFSWKQKALTINQIWEKVKAVHSIDLEQVEHLSSKRAWYNSCDPNEANESIHHVVQLGYFSVTEGNQLVAILNRFWKALPHASLVLNHGDITMDNLLWHQGQVVSLMDFEFSVIAPEALDLNSVVKLAFGPNDEWINHSELNDLQQTVLNLAKPILTQPGGKDLLLGYTILLELYRFELWIANSDENRNIKEWDPYRRLRSLIDGGGYLAPLLSYV